MENGINLVEVNNNQVVTSSLKIAEVFEKEHRNVTQAIENLTAENSAVKQLFQEDIYTNNRGRQ